MPKKQKEIQCVVQSIDCMMAFNVVADTSGRDLLDMIFTQLGVYEKHWFGLFYYDQKDIGRWLSKKQKINLKNVKPYPDTSAHFKFTIRYFPEAMKVELIQDCVKILFFKYELSRLVTDPQVDILPEHRVLTAVAYACLVAQENKSSSPEEVIKKKFTRIFPAHVLARFELTTQDWMDAIQPALQVAKTQHYTEPLQQALDCMEQSPMHGITYFDIKNNKETDLLLGVDCFGLTIFKPDDRVNPKVAFVWSEISKVSYAGKKFIIELTQADSIDLIFHSRSSRICDQMLKAIAKNHTNFLSRRKADAKLQLEIKEANKAQKALTKEKKLFEEQAHSHLGYESTVEEMIQTGNVDDAHTKLMEEQFQKTKETMEKQIEEAQRLANEERNKKAEAEKELMDLREQARLMEQKIVTEKKEKESFALLEIERQTQEEATKGEIERLNKMLGNLEVKHQEDLKKLQDLKIESPSAIGSSSETIHQVSLEEVKKKQNQDIQDNIKKFGTLVNNRRKVFDGVGMQIHEFTAAGKSKFETLKILRQNNTKSRVDEFQSL